MIDKKIQGKKNREKGQRFELAVRKDLEKRGWIVSKWHNNVEIVTSPNQDGLELIVPEETKCIQAKRKYNPFIKAFGFGAGFPDFICFKNWGKRMVIHNDEFYKGNAYVIIFVEAKTNGYLSKVEKEKANWYLKNGYCSEFLIAKKGKKGVEYKTYEAN